ncbi:MAG: class I SAM-dependent RNA methyltransferase, partial [Bryobacteraceae bacterium]
MPASSETNASAVNVTVERLVYGGDGLAHIDGRVVLMPYVLPGETAVVRPSDSKPHMLRAKLVRVETPNAARVAPPCPYFGRCGGCQYQHASYDYQLSQKVSILREVMQRIGKLEAPEQIETLAGPEWNYRNRSQFHLSGGRIGYLQAGTHQLCPVDYCPISSPRLNEALAGIRQMMKEPPFPQFIRSLELFTNESEVQINVLDTAKPVARRFFEWCAERIRGYKEGPVDYTAAGESFRVSHRSFFQVNRFLVDSLVQAAIREERGDSAIDLYAGVGLFSVPLARRFRQVTAVEASSSAVQDLQFNTVRAGVQVHAVKQRAEEFLAAMHTAPDFVLADPPRAGLGKPVV